jgi:hypothetical protein
VFAVSDVRQTSTRELLSAVDHAAASSRASITIFGSTLFHKTARRRAGWSGSFVARITGEDGSRSNRSTSARSEAVRNRFPACFEEGCGA